MTQLSVRSGMMLGGGAILTLGTLKLILLKYRRGPKGYKSSPPASAPRQKSGEITRDRFTKKKVPADLDVILVGSGISSLYCAALLSKMNYRCLVLEQHYVAGGCTHCFSDKGWEFDTGVHYVGRVEKYGHLLDLVTLNDSDRVKFEKLGNEADGWVYDVIKIGDMLHPLRAGREAFVEDLAKAFPEEREAIDKYLDMVIKCNKSADLHFFGKLFHPVCSWIIDKTLGSSFSKLAGRTVQDVLDELFASDDLKAILSGQFGDYGMPPSKASFFIHAGIVAHYLDGGYYPVGGPQKIAEALIPIIESRGGRVLVNAEVEKIITNGGRATGVKMKSGDVISAPITVSGAGAEATEALLNGWKGSSKEDLKDGISHLYLFLGIEGSAEDLGLPSSNLWALPSSDIQGDLDRYYTDPDKYLESGSMLQFIGFPSAKDPEQRTKGKSTCVAISEAKASWFEEWSGTEQGRRGEKYEATKKRFGAAMLKGLVRHFPQLEGKVTYTEVATPLTNMYYLRRAASYGLQHPPERYTLEGGLRPNIMKGLWLTGQDVTTNGFAGALMGGILTAHGIAGYGLADLVLCGRDLITDMKGL